jgi:hypothetical protein
MSVAVFGWVEFIQQDLKLQAQAARELDARAMAHSGAAIGLHMLVTQRTPLLDEEFSFDRGFKVRLVSEGGRLNIKWLLAGEEPRKLELFKRWLEQRGVGFKERDEFVDCLLDWIDADNVKHLNGVEDDGDYHPPNRPFESLDEIEKVRGSAALTKTAGWKDQLTLDSQGPIDLSAAPVEILRLLPGLGEARIVRFVQYRQGKDGLDGTLDDNLFKNLQEMQTYLGISAAQFRELGGMVTDKDPTVHVTSEGRAGNVYRQLEVVARKGGPNPQILSWKE